MFKLLPIKQSKDGREMSPSGVEALKVLSTKGSKDCVLQHMHPPPGAWLLPTDSEERELVRAMNASGAADGITGERDGSVDGMGFDKHINVLRELRGMILTEFT
jgi:hypothetical protein